MSSNDPGAHGLPQQQPSQPQYAQPGAAPQYAQQAPPPGAPQQQPAYGSPPAPRADGRVDVLGIVALVLVALPALTSFLTPLIYRQAAVTGGMAVVGFAIPATHLAVMIVAAGLALAGVLQRGATRFRWAAVGALVAAALGIVSVIGGTVGGWLMSMIPY